LRSRVSVAYPILAKDRVDQFANGIQSMGGPATFFGTYHIEVAKLLLCESKLSTNARECLRSGLPFQDIVDAWNLAIREQIYAFIAVQ
jgi:hypothetical protein